MRVRVELVAWPPVLQLSWNSPTGAPQPLSVGPEGSGCPETSAGGSRAPKGVAHRHPLPCLPPAAHRLPLPRRRGPAAAHVADRGGGHQEDQHGSPLHRRLPRRQRRGQDPLRDSQDPSVRARGEGEALGDPPSAPRRCGDAVLPSSSQLQGFCGAGAREIPE